jgi:hypothetical protein
VLPPNATAASVSGQAATVLFNLRRALRDAQDFYLWVAAQSDTDLDGLFTDPAYVSALRSAMADANELGVLYNGGALGTYTLPYNFSASQRLLIGPQ